MHPRSILLSFSISINYFTHFCDQIMPILLGLVAIFILSSGVELMVAIVSLRGTPMKEAPRSSIVYLLYFRIGES